MVNDESLAAYLEALASSDSTPGGGSAAAVAAATAAALVAMSCRVTIGREKYREHEATMVAARNAADDLRQMALRLSVEDMEAYGAVNAARTLPRRSVSETEVRISRIQDALQGATDVPLRIAEGALRILQMCESVVDGANVNAVGDLGVGVLLAGAALDGAVLSVKLNLTLIKDPGFRKGVYERLGQMDDIARPLRERLAEGIRARAES